MVKDCIATASLWVKEPMASVFGHLPRVLLGEAELSVFLDALRQAVEKAFRARSRGHLHQLQILYTPNDNAEEVVQRVGIHADIEEDLGDIVGL